MNRWADRHVAAVAGGSYAALGKGSLYGSGGAVPQGNKVVKAAGLDKAHVKAESDIAPFAVGSYAVNSDFGSRCNLVLALHEIIIGAGT